MINDTENNTHPTRSDITAMSMNRLTPKSDVEVNSQVTIDDMSNMLEKAMNDDADGKGLLFEQAQTLNALFHRMLEKGVGGKSYSGEYFPDHISEKYIRLALKAQKQCSMSIDVLSKIDARKAFCDAGITSPDEMPPTPYKNDETN